MADTAKKKVSENSAYLSKEINKVVDQNTSGKYKSDAAFARAACISTGTVSNIINKQGYVSSIETSLAVVLALAPGNTDAAREERFRLCQQTPALKVIFDALWYGTDVLDVNISLENVGCRLLNGKTHKDHQKKATKDKQESKK